MVPTGIAPDRTNHWISNNHQCRIPKRWVSFDTESLTEQDDKEGIQSWRSGAAVFWRRDLKSGDGRRDATYRDPKSFWQDVADYCRPGTRTVAIAHNLGHDLRISRALEILPMLGFELEWCNLDRNVSTMTWRSDRGTLVLVDLLTWLPMPLHKVAKLVDSDKLRMPSASAGDDRWDAYCLRDAEIVYLAKSRILDWIASEQLGNWQPTGAGMSYATWRHRFMSHKVLVHNNPEVIAAERAAMHTGRAEAWRHGILAYDMWHEIDLRTAYTRIAAECDLPTKYKFSTEGINQVQYEQLSRVYRVNCLVDVSTDTPIVPHHDGHRTIWPVGQFRTWIWDVEVNELLAQNSRVTILAAHVYTKAPILAAWANWVLSVQNSTSDDVQPVIRAFAKHTGRALIGRLSLRAPKWELFGENPFGDAGLSFDVDYETGDIRRMMHVGNKTLVETARVEGRDSLPQVTGWIMAECRIRLWWAMVAAGLENIAHVDTDSVLVNRAGLHRMQDAYSGSFLTLFQRKGQWPALAVYGPRNLRAGRERKIAGVPLKAVETLPDTFVGEKWRSLASDMANGRAGNVTVVEATWTVKREDPRRRDAPGVPTRTVAVRLPVD